MLSIRVKRIRAHEVVRGVLLSYGSISRSVELSDRSDGETEITQIYSLIGLGSCSIFFNIKNKFNN